MNDGGAKSDLSQQERSGCAHHGFRISFCTRQFNNSPT
jgi:hypothetical protein